MKDTLKLVIVGSVDHGKSTLIGRLLFDTNSLPREKIEEIEKTCKALGRDLEFAYLIDHLQEEREKEMTIDTAHTFFKSKIREYVIIDAPGHKEFIQNMITGASQADVAILIVDASEGVVEQTKRHAYILNLLSIKNVIVAVNKIDKIGYDQEKFNKVKSEIIKFLERLNTIKSKVIPISAKHGDNIVKRSSHTVWYSDKTILEELDDLNPSRGEKSEFLRLPIQDAYSINGEKIFVGKIENGNLGVGDKVVSLPKNDELKVKKILNFDGQRMKLIDKAEAGYNIGVIFDGKDLKRGDIVCQSNKRLLMNSKIKANIFWLDQISNYKVGDRISMRCATQEIEGRIEKIEKRIDSSTLNLIEENADNLGHTEVGEVNLVLSRPLVFEDSNLTPELGRFVLIQNQDVVAGGIIKS